MDCSLTALAFRDLDDIILNTRMTACMKHLRGIFNSCLPILFHHALLPTRMAGETGLAKKLIGKHLEDNGVPIELDRDMDSIA